MVCGLFFCQGSPYLHTGSYPLHTPSQCERLPFLLLGQLPLSHQMFQGTHHHQPSVALTCRTDSHNVTRKCMGVLLYLQGHCSSAPGGIIVFISKKVSQLPAYLLQMPYTIGYLRVLQSFLRELFHQLWKDGFEEGLVALRVRLGELSLLCAGLAVILHYQHTTACSTVETLRPHPLIWILWSDFWIT